MTQENTKISGPHGQIAVSDAREKFTCRLFDELWDRYRERVSYVRDYEKVIAKHGATFVNDHIAFRTLATQSPLAGISSLSRIFEALGFSAAGCYQFPDKHLSAIHFQHANPEFPKLFISELRIWELRPTAEKTIASVTASQRPAISLDGLRALDQLREKDSSEAINETLLTQVCDQFQQRPWGLLNKGDLEAINKESQYAAWVLVHGYDVNHFTSLINSHGPGELEDIEKTVAALKAAGVPMKAEIEGEQGSKLRQTATAAVEIDVPVLDTGKETTTTWSYAYFELAERGEVKDPETGKPCRFEGFLGPQATQLFEMTRRG